MKKSLIVLVLLIMAVAGILVGCGEDKYANLSISLSASSIASSTEVEIREVEGEDGVKTLYLDLEYGQPVDIVATVSGMTNINYAVNFACSDPDAISFANLVQTSTGSSVRVTGQKPSENDNYYIVKVSSVESSTKYVDVYVRVVLPIESLNFKDNLKLGITEQNPINVFDYLIYSKKDGFTTNQREVEFILDGDTEGITLVKNQKDQYTGQILASEDAQGSFTLQAVSAVSGKSHIKTEQVTVTIFEDITNLNYVGSQVQYNNGESDDKFSTILFSNVDKTYSTESDIEGNYSYEDVTVTIKTKHPIIISCLIDANSGDNVIREPQSIGKVTTESEGILYSTETFRIYAKGTGTAYVYFKAQYPSIDNVGGISYKFDKIFAEDDFVGSRYRDNSHIITTSNGVRYYDAKITIKSSGIPVSSVITQDSVVLRDSEMIVIYDEYANTSTTSSWGSKISVALQTGGISTILSENLTVKVQISDIEDFDLQAYNFSSRRWTAPAIQTDRDGNNFIILDISKNNGNSFYMLAKEVTNKEYNINITPIIKTTILSRTGEEITTDQLSTNYPFSYNCQTRYGVNKISAVDTNGTLIGCTDPTQTTTKLVLRKSNNSEPTADEGSLLMLFVNENADDYFAEPVVANPNYIKVFAQSNPVFTSEATQGMDIVKTYAFVGLREGSTTITFIAKNGCTLVINVRVVSQSTGLNLSIDDNYNSNVITYKNAGTQLRTAYAKVNENFLLDASIAPNASGVMRYSYLTSNNAVAFFENGNSIRTLADGEATITVRVFYYNFVTDENGFISYEEEYFEKSFDLTVFTPSTSISLASGDEYITVYDSNSLGFKYQDQSIFDVNVVITPNSATIFNDSSKVIYSESGNKNNLVKVSGVPGRYQAFLNDDEDFAIVYVLVIVNEFGTSIPLVSTIKIVRAVQVQKVITNVSDFYDEAKTSYYLSLRQGESFELDTVVVPNNPHVSDLEYIWFNVTTNVAGKKIVGSSILGGQTLLTLSSNKKILTATTESAGYIFLRIFACDSMTSVDAGKVYATILIQVTDGTISNPYEIKTEAQLQAIKNAPNKHFVLSNNILITSRNWDSIENFCGSLNGFNINISGGKYFSVNDFTLNNIGKSNLGLFSNVMSDGAILNLKITVKSISLIGDIDAETYPEINVGAIAGHNNGLIMNCEVVLNSFKVDLNTLTNVGGIVGKNEGLIVNIANPNGFATNMTLQETDEEEYINGHKFAEIIDSFRQEYYSSSVGNRAKEIIELSASKNPVNGHLTVSDRDAAGAVNAGGIAGVNTGTINGIYGLYLYIENGLSISSTGVEYIVSYQSQGVDSKIYINFGDEIQIGEIVNENSSVGGLVGLQNEDGKIFNCSTDGKVVGLNNVGGLVGTAGGEIRFSLSSCKIQANQNVGGAVGYADGLTTYEVRVENYQTNATANDDYLIVAKHNVGGVVGFSNNSTLNYTYANTYVDEAATGYNADVYILALDGVQQYVGGIVGSSQSTAITNSYYKLKIAKHNLATVASDFDGKNCISGTAGATIGDCYSYPYSSADAEFKHFINNNSGPGWSNNPFYIQFNNDNPVLRYTYNSIECYFLRLVPEEISISVENNVSIALNNTECEVLLGDEFFGANDGSSENWLMVLEYAEDNTQENIYSLNDLLAVGAVAYGTNIKNLSIYVESSNTLLVKINDNGTLQVLGVGEAEITFRAKLRYSASDKITVKIISKFDKLSVFQDVTHNNDLITLGTYNLRKTSSVVDENTGEITEIGQRNYLLTDEVLYNNNIALINTSMFTYEYATERLTGDEGELEVDPNGFYSLSVGEYRVDVSVLYKTDFDGKNWQFSIINNWTFNVVVFEGATGIVISSDDEVVEISGFSLQDVDVTLLTDKETDNVSYSIKDDNGTEYNYVYNTEIEEWQWQYKQRGTTVVLLTELEQDVKRNIQSGKFVPFEVVKTDAPLEGSFVGELYYTFTFKVMDCYKEFLKGSKNFYLVVTALSNAQVTATVTIKLVPQKLVSVSARHYAYSETIKNNAESAYSYTATPSNKIIPGFTGMLEIDILPYYSDIAQIKVYSSLDTSTGSQMQFAQLVRIASNDVVSNDTYYIFGPQTESINDGAGITLNLISYVSTNTKLAIFEDETTHSKTYQYSDASPLAYKFGESEIAADPNNAEITKLVRSNYNNGKLYVQTISPTNLAEETEFDITVEISYYGINESGDVVLQEPYKYTHKIFVDPVPAVKLTASRNVIAYTDETSKTGDSIELSTVVAEGYQLTQEPYIYLVNDAEPIEDICYIVDGVFTLGKSARIGDVIKIRADVAVDVESYSDVISSIIEIRVVDVVIENISIEDLNADNELLLTVSTSKQLRAKIIGYGTPANIYNAEVQISRKLEQSLQDGKLVAGQTAVWKSYVNSTAYSLDNSTLSLPFTVNKLSYTEDNSAVIITGKTSVGSASLSLQFNYAYNIQKGVGVGKIYILNNLEMSGVVASSSNYSTSTFVKKDFTVRVRVDSSEDNPDPIYTAEELYAMSSNGNYILMNDITLPSHTAINAKIASFDGNNKVITIENFKYNENLQGSTSENSINIGLFDTIDSTTIIKNVIVALPNDKSDDAALKLNYYSTINFGAIAAINNGIITNCEVITVDYKNNSSQNGQINTHAYVNSDYTINIETNRTVGTNAVVANVGGVVGVNAGYITNSRIGNEMLEVVKLTDESSIVGSELFYQGSKNGNPVFVAPVTLIKVNGRATVGGFISSNSGTISNCFAKNIQLEVKSKSGISTEMLVAGFVCENSGYVYGSSVAGWEEDTLMQPEDARESLISGSRRLGGGIYSNGYVGGFVYNNLNIVQDCYSSINVSGTVNFAFNSQNITAAYTSPGDDGQYGNLFAGGFVYFNGENGRIITSYSNSRIGIRLTPHGIFVGKTTASGVNNSNENGIECCYYLKEKSVDSGITTVDDPAQQLTDQPSIEIDESSDVEVKNEFINKEAFSGFSIYDEDKWGETFDNEIVYKISNVWVIKTIGNGEYGYPELVSANRIAKSVRTLNVTQTNEETGEYFYNYVEGYEKGSVNNPQVIYNATQYNNLFNDTIDSYTLVNENVSVKNTDNIRIAQNIDFTGVTMASTIIEYTVSNSQNTIFDGNYMALTNIKLNDASESNSSFGLFRTLYGVGVKCLTLSFVEVNARTTTAVGGLAGVIVNSSINTINLVSSDIAGTNDQSGTILGNNYVGGLAGLIVANENNQSNKIENINSNLSVIAGTPGGEDRMTTLKPSILWSKILPPSAIQGSVSSNNNLRLYNLPTDYFYAGGIAGVIDIKQYRSAQYNSSANVSSLYIGDIDQTTAVVADYEKKASVEGQYVGGIVGFVGNETYLKYCNFEVYNTQREQEDPNAEVINENYLKASYVAGGIVAQNYGYLNQVYIEFESSLQTQADDSLIDFTTNTTEGGTLTTFNTEFFSNSGELTYAGGLVGINVQDHLVEGSGHIFHSYSRIDVRNEHAKVAGGIVGASYGGLISNVYTTGSVIGDFSSTSTSIGALIGTILGSEDNIFITSREDATAVILQNSVAVNMWNNDFDAVYDFVSNGGKVGVIYGNSSANGEDAIISLRTGIYLQSHIIRNFENEAISSEEFVITDIPAEDRITLWTGIDNTIAGWLGTTSDDPSDPESSGSGDTMYVISANKLKAMYDYNDGYNETYRQLYFSSTFWPRSIWSTENEYTDEKYILPRLEIGYSSDVVRIYNAEEFNYELSSETVSSKTYVIMCDIDFEGYDIAITNTFRGSLYGNSIKYYKDESEENFVSRKPILYNLNLQNPIFKEAMDAKFQNFNIVLGEYNNYSSDSLSSSVLVGNATSVLINNVNVFTSITDFYDSKANSAYTDTLGNPATLTYGKGSQGQQANFVALGDLEDNINYFLFNPGTKATTYQYVNSRLSAITERTYKPTPGSPGQYSQLNFYEYGEQNVSGNYIRVRSAMFGGIVGYGTSVNIYDSFVNLGENVISINTGANGGDGIIDNDIHSYGCMVGLLFSGSLNNCSAVGDINYTHTDFSALKINNVFIGGLVGNIKGIITIGYYRDSNINVEMVLSRVKVYVGGIVGQSEMYSTVNGANVGGIANAYVDDAEIIVSAAGDVCVGGIVGKTYYTASNIYFGKNSPRSNNRISVTSSLTNENAVKNKMFVGGTIGFYYTGGEINYLYNNASITVDGSVSGLETYAGGVIGRITLGSKVNSAINDGDLIEVLSTAGKDCYVGGLIGDTCVYGSANSVTLNKGVNAANIVVESQNRVSLGGAIALSTGDVYIGNIISLGNIKYNKGESDRFITGEVAIGGLIGSSSKSNVNLKDNCVIASTLRNYEIAQQTNLKMGAVFGYVNQLVVANENAANIYYNEAIALINGGNSYATSVEQTELGTYITNILFEITNAEKITNYTVWQDYLNFIGAEGIDTNIHQTYDIDIENGTQNGDFKLGSKINPIEVNSENFSSVVLTSNNYYVLTQNIANTNAMAANQYSSQNWVLNCKGYLIGTEDDPVETSVFNVLPLDSAVVGMLVYANITVQNEQQNVGIIANQNNGVIFSCGTKGNLTSEVGSAKIGGLAGINAGSIIASFSMANITIGSGHAGGLVGTNYASADNFGQIFTSYFTGKISSSTNTPDANILAGLAGHNRYGFISNCYSMSNIETVDKENAYALAWTYDATSEVEVAGGGYVVNNVTRKIYNSYYDVNSFNGKGSTYEVKNALQDTHRDGLESWDGFYASTGDLEGKNISNASYVNSLNLKGSWYSSDEQWKAIWESCSLSYEGGTSQLTSAWFNYGYAVTNYNNIIIDNGTNFLLFIYTYNGKAEVVSPDDTTSGFIDGPYKIYHAGMLESYALNDNGGSYYIVIGKEEELAGTTRRILDFTNYSEKFSLENRFRPNSVANRYWSEIWDMKGTSFKSNINGNDAYIVNLSSDYGLFRALESYKVVDEETNIPTEMCYVHDLTLYNSYSQTGLIAGYMNGGLLDFITIESSSESDMKNASAVYNSDLHIDDDSHIIDIKSEYIGMGLFSELDLETNIYPMTKAIKGIRLGLLSDETKRVIWYNGQSAAEAQNVAGGLVALMEEGEIGSHVLVAENNNFHVFGNDISGGFVGIFNGGEIGSISTENAGNLYVYASPTEEIVDSGYAGGIVGYMVKGLLEDIIVTPNVYVNSSYVVGGIIGRLVGNSNSEFKNVNESEASATLSNKKIAWVEGNAFDEVDQQNTSTYIGGIVGYMDGGRVSSSWANIETVQGNISLEHTSLVYATDSYTLYLGVIAGWAGGGTIDDSFFISETHKGVRLDFSEENFPIGGFIGLSSIFIGGVAGGMNAGIITSSSTEDVILNYWISITSSHKAVAGGVVGFMSGGEITSGRDSYIINNGTIDAKVTEIAEEKVAYAGGLVGEMKLDASLTLSGLKNQGTVAAGTCAGGIVGVGEVVVAEFEDVYQIEFIATDLANYGIIGSTENVLCNYAGGVIGKFVSIEQENCKIEKVENYGEINAVMYAGGVAGELYSCLVQDVINSANESSSGIVTTLNTQGIAYSGGIVGFGENIYIKNVTNSNTISSEGSAETYAGGIAGKLISSTVEEAQNISEDVVGTEIVTIGEQSYAGGIVGFLADGSIFNCQNTLNVNGQLASGGIVGRSSGRVFFVINTGEISGASIVGGIVGVIEKTEEVAIYRSQIGITSVEMDAIEAEELELVTFGEISTNNVLNKGIVYGGTAGLGAYIGGIVGQMNGGIMSGFEEAEIINEGLVSVATGAYGAGDTLIFAGGIIGLINEADNELLITYVINKATIGGIIDEVADGFSTMYAGGIIGNSNVTTLKIGTVTNEGNVYALQQVNEADPFTIVKTSYAGGIAGSFSSEIGSLVLTEEDDENLIETNIYSKGDVTGVYAGGFAGQMNKTITISRGINIYIEGMIGGTETETVGGEDGDQPQVPGEPGVPAEEPSVPGEEPGVGEGGTGTGLVSRSGVMNDKTYYNIASYAGGLIGNLTQSAQLLVVEDADGNNLQINTVVLGVSAGGLVGYVDGSSIIETYNVITNQAGAFEYANTNIENKTKVDVTVYGFGQENAGTGGVVGYMAGGSVKNFAYNHTGESDGIMGGWYIGGIVGFINAGDVMFCENASTLEGKTVMVKLDETTTPGEDTPGEDAPGEDAPGEDAPGEALQEREDFGYRSIGGIVGQLNGSGNIESCYNKGTVLGEVPENGGSAEGENPGDTEGDDGGEAVQLPAEDVIITLGGIAGYVGGGQILGCVNEGEIVSASCYAGGIVGYLNGGKVGSSLQTGSTQTENKGAVKGNYSGGIAGYVISGDIGTDSQNTVINSGAVGSSSSEDNVLSAGGLVGYMENGNIFGINKGSINSFFATGGIAGCLKGGNLVNAKNEHSIDDSASYVGGIIGYAEGGGVNLTNIKNSQSVKASSGGCAGGVIGFASQVILQAGVTNGGSVSASGSGIGGKMARAGGIIGYADSCQLDNGPSNTKSVSCSGGIAGGLVGDCYATSITGDNSGKVSGVFAGGIAGFVSGEGTVQGASSGEVLGSGGDGENYAGGTVGVLNNGTAIGTSSGTISAVYAGGVVGCAKGGNVQNAGVTASIGDSSSIAIGGLIGKVDGEVALTSSGGIGGTVGNSNISSTCYVGGAVGLVSGTLTAPTGQISFGNSSGQLTLYGNTVGGIAGFVSANGIIKDLEIGGSSDSATAIILAGNVKYFGFVVGLHQGKLINCTRGGGNLASSDSVEYLGGIVGCAGAAEVTEDTGGTDDCPLVEGCENNADLNSTASSGSVGGIVGFISNTCRMVAVRNTAKISIGSSGKAGGIIGHVASNLSLGGKIENSGDITGGTVGGIISVIEGSGGENGIVVTVFSRATAYGQQVPPAGGGEANTIITNSGKIGSTENSIAGGFCSEMSEINVKYGAKLINTGKIVATNYAGGLFGKIGKYVDDGTTEKTNTGDIGIIGANLNGTLTTNAGGLFGSATNVTLRGKVSTSGEVMARAAAGGVIGIIENGGSFKSGATLTLAATVTAKVAAGGIVGENVGTCEINAGIVSNGKRISAGITATKNSAYAGGAVGNSSGAVKIANFKNSGIISALGTYDIGECPTITAGGYSVPTHSKVSVSNKLAVGGAVGAATNDDSIVNCSNDGKLVAEEVLYASGITAATSDGNEFVPPEDDIRHAIAHEFPGHAYGSYILGNYCSGCYNGNSITNVEYEVLTQITTSMPIYRFIWNDREFAIKLTENGNSFPNIFFYGVHVHNEVYTFVSYSEYANRRYSSEEASFHFLSYKGSCVGYSNFTYAYANGNSLSLSRAGGNAKVSRGPQPEFTIGEIVHDEGIADWGLGLNARDLEYSANELQNARVSGSNSSEAIGNGERAIDPNRKLPSMGVNSSFTCGARIFAEDQAKEYRIRFALIAAAHIYYAACHAATGTASVSLGAGSTDVEELTNEIIEYDLERYHIPEIIQYMLGGPFANLTVKDHAGAASASSSLSLYSGNPYSKSGNNERLYISNANPDIDPDDPFDKKNAYSWAYYIYKELKNSELDVESNEFANRLRTCVYAVCMSGQVAYEMGGKGGTRDFYKNYRQYGGSFFKIYDSKNTDAYEYERKRNLRGLDCSGFVNYVWWLGSGTKSTGGGTLTLKDKAEGPLIPGSPRVTPRKGHTILYVCDGYYVESTSEAVKITTSPGNCSRIITPNGWTGINNTYWQYEGLGNTDAGSSAP